MMRRVTAFLATLMIGAAAAAQESEPAPAPVPDYSRDKLVRIFSNDPVREKVEPRIQWTFGFIDFKALGMRWNLGYLPIMVPLSGSIPWQANGAFGALPDPFELTHTQIASPPHTWKKTRDMSVELKRIQRLEKERARITVQVKPE